MKTSKMHNQLLARHCSVLDEIEARSGKQIKKEQAIISGVVSDLSKENTFVDIEILSTRRSPSFGQ